MADLSGQIKAAIMAHLDASPDVTAIIPVARIYPMQPSANPARPFIRYGIPTIQPFEDSCGRGVDMTIPLHGFAQSEDQAQTIAATIEAAMQAFAPTGLRLITCDWDRTTFLHEEAEADLWHAHVTFSLTATA